MDVLTDMEERILKLTDARYPVDFPGIHVALIASRIGVTVEEAEEAANFLVVRDLMEFTTEWRGYTKYKCYGFTPEGFVMRRLLRKRGR